MTYGRRHYLTQQVLAKIAYAGPTGDETREFLRATGRLMLATTIAFFVIAGLASAQEPVKSIGEIAAEVGASVNEAASGSFLFREIVAAPATRDLPFAIAPLVDTRVHFDVKGVVARAVVTQRFVNPSDAWVEGVYVFPLPEGAAVDHLKMRAGDRVIEGQIREKEQARLEFQKAATEGKRATLVEQQRPNLFTTKVANLGPKETLEVEIEYQQTLQLAEGKVSLRFPLTITPRYMAGITAGFDRLFSREGAPGATDGADPDSVEAEGLSTGTLTRASLPLSALSSPDDARVLNPQIAPAGHERQSVEIELKLSAGFDVDSVHSPSHSIGLAPRSARDFVVTLRGGKVVPDRDFEVLWRPVEGRVPESDVVTETGPGGTYSVVTLFPPTGRDATSARLPRDVTFIVDTSGSMEGASMAQAKAALDLALGRLQPEDRFNVIQFNSVTSLLFDEQRPATKGNVESARRYVRALEANGGTEMAPALDAALGFAPAAGALRQVIFITDGAVGDEDRLFSIIKGRLGAARLFTVGIGSAPNSHFMTKAAEFGRGTFTFIGNLSEVGAKMGELYAKVENPVLSDIAVEFFGASPGGSMEVWPKRIPDLYLGEPLVVAARLSDAPTTVRVTGRLDGAPYEVTVPLAGASEGEGAHVLWARRKVQSLLDSVHEGADAAAVRAEVVNLGLEHHLVTKYTSLIAVDVTPVRPAEAALVRASTAIPAPLGSTHWSGGLTTAALPQSATPATLQMTFAAALWLVALALWWGARRHAGPAESRS